MSLKDKGHIINGFHIERYMYDEKDVREAVYKLIENINNFDKDKWIQKRDVICEINKIFGKEDVEETGQS